MSDIDIETKKGFLYLQGYMERVLLVPQSLHPSMWLSLYVLAFGANGICRNRGGNIALSFLPEDDEHFSVEVQGDDPALLDEVHEMIEAFGQNPSELSTTIMDGEYPGMQPMAPPDHDEILAELAEVLGLDDEPRVVAVIETEEPDAAEDRDFQQITPEMEYWVDYWGMRNKRQRAI